MRVSGVLVFTQTSFLLFLLLSMKKQVIILIIVIVIVLLIFAGTFFFLMQKGVISFGGADFSKGTLSFGALGKSNAFENVKLNPFRNETNEG